MLPRREEVFEGVPEGRSRYPPGSGVCWAEDLKCWVSSVQEMVHGQAVGVLRREERNQARRWIQGYIASGLVDLAQVRERVEESEEKSRPSLRGHE